MKASQSAEAAMVNFSPQDPITRLIASHTDTRRQLRILVPDARPPDPASVQAAIAWIDGPAQAQRHILEQILFPALIESMAGSDAVCLKGMTQGLIRQSADLDHRWHQAIRAELMQPHPDAAPLTAWVEGFLAYLQLADEELLPMAGRLLDDAALADLARACETGFSDTHPPGY
ncbi:MAG: hemerythrin domain-containing protein [Castellaniella sp.]|nr:hemerythrin domain-containing protein [Castellaniella sp.]